MHFQWAFWVMNHWLVNCLSVQAIYFSFALMKETVGICSQVRRDQLFCSGTFSGKDFSWTWPFINTCPSAIPLISLRFGFVLTFFLPICFFRLSPTFAWQSRRIQLPSGLAFAESNALTVISVRLPLKDLRRRVLRFFSVLALQWSSLPL